MNDTTIDTVNGTPPPPITTREEQRAERRRRIKAILELPDGLTLREVAKRIGLPRVTTAFLLCRDAGYQTRPTGRPLGTGHGPVPLTTERLSILEHGAKENWTLKQVGDALGTTRQYARHLYKLHGIARTNRRGGGRGRPLSAKSLALIEDVTKNGLNGRTGPQLAKQHGVSVVRIYSLLRPRGFFGRTVGRRAEFMASIVDGRGRCLFCNTMQPLNDFRGFKCGPCWRAVIYRLARQGAKERREFWNLHHPKVPKV
jgi:transposase